METTNQNKSIFDSLCKKIEELNQRYNIGEAAASDELFNSLLYNAQQMQVIYPELYNPDNPINHVRKDIVNKPVKHLSKMMSLQNAFTEDDLDNFFRQCVSKVPETALEYAVEDKLDGLALAVVYLDGLCIGGSTRGDGVYGEDIGVNINYIRDIPTHITMGGLMNLFEVRGEVVILKEDYLKLKEMGHEYANTRNAVVGLIRSKNIDKELLRFLSFRAYDVYPCISKTQQGMALFLEVLGFKTPYISEWFSHNDISMLKYTCINAVNRRESLPYDIDGLVIKVQDVDVRGLLGHTEHHPLWATAYKFPAMEGYAIVEDVMHSLGRTGVITPVALFKTPVPIGGVNVSRCTLHNYDEIARLDIGIGDVVQVIRAGDVIPKIQSVYTRLDNRPSILPPSHCPSCNSTPVRKGVFLTCANPNCNDIRLADYLNFVSPDGLDITGLGTETLSKLITHGVIKNYADILNLTVENIVSTGIGVNIANNILRSISDAKNVRFSKFIVAIGIPNVGPYSAKQLALHFKTWENFTDAFGPLIKIKGIGPETLKSIADFKADTIAITSANDAALLLNILPEDNTPEQINGRRIVITGSFDNYTRAELTRLLTIKGFTVYSSVSSFTHYLAVGNKPSADKIAKAQQFNVPILDVTGLESLGVFNGHLSNN
jgi:DNA ligase (NAD+)